MMLVEVRAAAAGRAATDRGAEPRVVLVGAGEAVRARGGSCRATTGAGAGLAGGVRAGVEDEAGSGQVTGEPAARRGGRWAGVCGTAAAGASVTAVSGSGVGSAVRPPWMAPSTR